ncbi:hypothetical protein E1178_04640 [Roseibium hamelinense]|nr:hypothetical protein [Roseibium hamelinense]
MLGAAVFGGVVVVSAAYGLHAAGVLKLPAGASEETSALLQSAETKIANLEQQIADLSQNGVAQAAQQRVAELETRLSGLEGTVANAVSGSDSSGAADTSSALEALKSDVASLTTRIDDVASQLGAEGGAASGGGAAVSADALAGLESKVAGIETNLNAATETASSAQQSVTSLQNDMNALQSKVENAEATAKAAQTAVATSDTSLKTLADSQARASDTLASLSSDIQTMAQTQSASLAEIKSELAAMSARIATVESTMGDATAREVAARALSVSALKSAVDSGRPYQTELAAVKAGLPADTDLAALEAHAENGIAPVSVLIAEFPGVARKMFGTFAQPEQSGDLLDSFLASAKSIVSVRGPGDADGSGPAATLRRMENAVSNGNLSAALTAYQELPAAAQAAGSDWAARAKARVEVDGLTEKASQEVLSELARKDS